MDKYIYLILGVILGLSIAIYIYASKKEKVEKQIALNSKILSTKKLQIALEKAFNRITIYIQTNKKELTEEIVYDILARLPLISDGKTVFYINY